MAQAVVVFSHGMDSEPWSSKIVTLAERARALGWRAESVDYRPSNDPIERVAKLLAFVRDLQLDADQQLVLVGSSLGGHVSTAASTQLGVHGLFLLAPAFYMQGYERYTPQAPNCPIAIVHGWRDDIVPVANSIRYAQEYRAILHVLDADHRMLDRIDTIAEYFAIFLRNLPQTRA